VVGHINIYGEVGKHVTLETVQKEIGPKNSSYIVHIHSPGGDVFEGYAIANAIKNTGKDITVHIEGLCASIATLIAATGSKIIMNTKSQFMIHNPRIASMAGESKDLRNVAAQLDKIKSQLIDSWVGRTSLTREQLSEMYDQETYLSPEQAVELGFADEVQEVLKAVASADIKKYNRMNDKKTLISGMMKIINSIFSPKNMTSTLADGRVILVPEEGEWTGQPITLEDGSPLEDGAYELADGKKVTIAGGVITEVIEPEAPPAEAQKEEEPKETPEDMELKAKLAAAEARIKELESAVATSSEVAAKAEAKAKSFENKLNVEVKELKEQIKKFENTTAGDATPPAMATKPVPPVGAVVNDPMQAWYQKNVIDKRNTD
jgi:ATP-dependent protease ClpP protease subunit